MKIKIMDLGFSLGILIGRKAYHIRLPFPVRWDTIKYSLREQGLWGTIRNRGFVRG